jgi:hypothetical protein
MEQEVEEGIVKVLHLIVMVRVVEVEALLK